MADDGATRRIPTDELKTVFAVGDVIARNYEILGSAGAGGMGVVYRARDLKLERTVALKFLPFEVIPREKDKQRFLTEARIASSLDHPNIGAIYGIDETADGRTFIVMAFYEGQSLADRIRFGGRLGISEVINGNKNETFNFKNENSNPVIVKQDGTKTWPFTTGPNLNVLAKVGSTAGTLPVTLIGTPGTYHYVTSGCPSDPRLVNPKTVIIT